MDFIFKPFLRKFWLVFFDHILIYRKYWQENVERIEKVLTQLEEKKNICKEFQVCLWGSRSEIFGSYYIA